MNRTVFFLAVKNMLQYVVSILSTLQQGTEMNELRKYVTKSFLTYFYIFVKEIEILDIS